MLPPVSLIPRMTPEEKDQIADQVISFIQETGFSAQRGWELRTALSGDGFDVSMQFFGAWDYVTSDYYAWPQYIDIVTYMPHKHAFLFIMLNYFARGIDVIPALELAEL